MRNYRVLLVDIARSFGGAEVRVLTQARALQDSVEKCAVATLEGSALHGYLQSENLPMEVIQDARSDPRMLFTLRKIIKNGGYQVIDAHNVQSIFWGHFAAQMAGAKGRVATIHSDFGGEYPGIKGQLYEGVLWLNRRVARQYINVTEVLQAKAEKQGLAERSSLIHNAVPVPDAPFDGQNTVLRESLGLASTDFVVGSIARLKPVKGQKYLIDALAQLNDLPHVKLVIVGDGPLRETLEEQVKSLNLQDRIIFTGFRKDIPEIMQMLDCVCMSSLSEALPYVVLEAASYARPLLVTEVGGMATLLDDEKTALMVPAEDASALAGGIRRLATNASLARQIGLAGYEMVQNQFSVERMLEKILEVYDRSLV